MTKFGIAIVLVLGLGMFGCDKLDKAFEDIQEEAPGACKTYCKNMVECQWGEQGVDYSGEKEEDARGDYLDRCIAECSFSATYGTYVVEWNDDGDEMEFVGNISGDKYMKFGKCMLQYYDCSDDVWSLDLEWDDEDDCNAMAECVAILGIDWEFKFDDDDDICEEDGDQSIWGGFGF